ncbi:hypothetical protein [Amycolatopsis sp. NPDC004625]|uniref:hypothetical protein n=1 Tax=Amycolatopsis sp. NPDC004625 TaxID=3154670 RepID=UPI0033ACBFBB
MDHESAYLGSTEYLLYSDSYFTGGPQFASPPFTFVNCIADTRDGNVGPGIALQHEHYMPDQEVLHAKKTVTSSWLNLTPDDEIACLISLVTGTRVRSGGPVRKFAVGGPTRGIPEFHSHRVPVWNPPERPLCPIPKQVSLEPVAEWVSRYYKLDAEDSVTLIRSAHQFRDALWIADADPELAWLLLVSSLETAASRHAQADISPAELLGQESPELASKLSPYGERHVEEVAQILTPIMKATKRFKLFVEEYAPEPPEGRPDKYAQVEWSRVVKLSMKVYGFRSEKLHAGIPFPAPLCRRLLFHEPPYEERPFGISAAVGNNTWQSDDLPMHLHIFSYIARGCLKNWWTSRIK